MKNLTQNFWFWLLITGIFLILVAALLTAGLKESNGWIWAIFILGLILSVWGIVLGVQNSEKIQTNILSPGVYTKSPEPVEAPVLSKPKINIPQSQRGFTASPLSLSSLGPD